MRNAAMPADYHKSPKAHLVKFYIQPTHGQSRTRTYKKWKGMLHRCNPDSKDAKNYANRGIYVCERWHTWENFFADMGEAPPGLSLDRLNNDGPYCKENCAWKTSVEQSRNKRTNKRIEFDGLNLTLPEWSDKTKIPWRILKDRQRNGWSIERMLTESPRPKGIISERNRY
jgi:hypothetical protein